MTQVDVPFSYAFALIYIQAAAFYGRLEASVGLALSIALPGIAGAAWQCVYGHLEFCIFVGFALVLFYFSTNQLRRSREVESLRHSLSTTTRVADQSMDLAFAALASEFGAMIHDLANYLMAMRTFNDILEIEDVLQDKELKLLLSDAKKSMEATCEIINHFKLKIKNRSNASNPNVTFSLRPIVESAIKTNKWYRRIAIQTEIHHDATINGYDEYLETILRNLINNAGEAGAKNIRVTTRLITGGSNLLLQISDDGPGISAEIRGKLFNEMVTWGKAHGNGMGIYMCRRLAQLLQADLMIESSTTQGTIFIIKFNLAGNRVGTA
jgi:signal transduction histidine kinase